MFPPPLISDSTYIESSMLAYEVIFPSGLMSDLQENIKIIKRVLSNYTGNPTNTEYFDKRLD